MICTGIPVGRAGDAPGLVRSALVDETKSPPPEAQPVYERGRWELGLESAYVFHSMRNPFFAVVGMKNTTPRHYRLATEILSVRYQLTNPVGPWLLRGVLEANAGVVGSAIVHGPESYFVGLALGFRYYFVQPNARLVPYLEVRGGPGVTDSKGGRYNQQQDFTFTYLLGAGLRYDINAHWSVTLSVIDQHISNAYLTDPNYGFDSVGADLGVVWRY